MRSKREISLCIAILCGSLFCLYESATAQNRSPRRSGRKASTTTISPGKTTVNVELLTGKEGVGLHAQQWGATFGKLGFSIRIRRAAGDIEPEIKERRLGSLRIITAIGRLARNGTIVFPDRTFTPAQTEELKEWLRALKTYGAQGDPGEQPLWGLSEKQFTRLYESLSHPLETDVAEKSFTKALETFRSEEGYAIRLTTHTSKFLKLRDSSLPNVGQSLKGFSRGTALAMMLNPYGLGFRPLRTPEGTIEIAIEPVSRTDDLWPVGWKPKGSPADTAPILFELIPVELHDVPFAKVLESISDRTKIPIRFDHLRIDEEEIDLAALLVSHPSRNTSWSLLLKRVCVQARLKRAVRVDEQGRPFLWLTTLAPRRKDR